MMPIKQETRRIKDEAQGMPRFILKPMSVTISKAPNTDRIGAHHPIEYAPATTNSQTPTK